MSDQMTVSVPKPSAAAILAAQNLLGSADPEARLLATEVLDLQEKAGEARRQWEALFARMKGQTFRFV